MDNNFGATINYRSFYVWDEAVNDVAPYNTLYLNIFNRFGKKLAYYYEGVVMQANELYIAEMRLRFSAGTEMNCLMRKEEAERLAFDLPDFWKASAPDEIKNSSMIRFYIDSGQEPQASPTTETLSFIIRQLASKTGDGSAQVKAEVVYYLLEEEKIAQKSEIYVLSILKRPPRLEILRFYSEEKTVASENKAALCWDVTCADNCEITQNSVPVENKFPGQFRYETNIYDDTFFSLFASNKKNRVLCAQDPALVVYEPDPLELTANGMFDRCVVNYGDSVSLRWKCPDVKNLYIKITSDYKDEEEKKIELGCREGEHTLVIQPQMNCYQNNEYTITLYAHLPVKGIVLKKEITMVIDNAIKAVLKTYFNLKYIGNKTYDVSWNIPQINDVPITIDCRDYAAYGKFSIKTYTTYSGTTRIHGYEPDREDDEEIAEIFVKTPYEQNFGLYFQFFERPRRR